MSPAAWARPRSCCFLLVPAVTSLCVLEARGGMAFCHRPELPTVIPEDVLPEEEAQPLKSPPSSFFDVTKEMAAEG